MRIITMLGLVLLALVTAAYADDLIVTPINPTAGAVVHRDVRFTFTIETVPSAVCSVDIVLPGGGTTYLPATRADQSGTATWPISLRSQPGNRTATAACRRGNDQGRATWTFLVE